MGKRRNSGEPGSCGALVREYWAVHTMRARHDLQPSTRRCIFATLCGVVLFMLCRGLTGSQAAATAAAACEPSHAFPAAPAASSASTGRVAMVVPMSYADLPLLERVVQWWEETPPCVDPVYLLDGLHADTNPHDLSMVWAFDGDFESPTGRRVRARLQAFVDRAGPPVRRCFGRIEFESVKPRRAVGAAVTPNFFRKLERQYAAFFLADANVRAARPNWAPALVSQASRLSCEGDWHIDGPDRHEHYNTLYMLGCPRSKEYVCRLQVLFKKTVDDHSSGGKYGRFAWSPSYQRMTGSSLDPGAAVTAAASPGDAYFVRSEEAHLSAPQLAVLGAYQRFNAYPSTADNAAVYLRIKAGELTEDMLVRQLCVQGDESHSAKWFEARPSAAGSPCAAFPQLSVPPKVRGAGRPVPPSPVAWDKRFAPNEAYVWSVDFHGAPVACNVPVLKEAGIVVHAEVEFGNCRFFGLCKDRLRVLGFDDWRGFSLETGGRTPEDLKAVFYDHYKDDKEFARVDAFMCSHPAANCELFVPFNKPLVIYVTTRLEFGRHDAGIDWRQPHIKADAPARWRAWVETLIDLAKDPRNTVAANNLYDVA